MSSLEFPLNAREHNKADVSMCFLSFLWTLTSTPEIILLFFEANNLLGIEKFKKIKNIKINFFLKKVFGFNKFKKIKNII